MTSQTLSGVDFFEMTMTSGAFDHYDGTFAGGQEANNKVDADILYKDPETRAKIVNGLAELAVEFKPDLIVPIPHGADKWGEALAHELGDIPVSRLKKIESAPGFKNTDFKNELSQGRVNRSKRLLLVEDFCNRWTSTRGGLFIPSVRRKAVGLVGIGYRGTPDNRVAAPIKSKFLWEHRIPDILEDNDPLWEYADTAGQ